MAEKCTNTSSPDWRWMNPKPLLALNHLTVPCSFTAVPLLLIKLFGASREFCGASSRNKKRPRGLQTRSPSDDRIPKVLQEQQTQQKTNTGLGAKLGKRWLERALARLVLDQTAPAAA